MTSLTQKHIQEKVGFVRAGPCPPNPRHPTLLQPSLIKTPTPAHTPSLSLGPTCQATFTFSLSLQGQVTGRSTRALWGLEIHHSLI